MKPQTQAALEAASESIVNAFGVNAQMVKTCEEMGELTTALCKKLNGSPVTHEQIVDEVADVLIMANQMYSIFGPNLVDERILFKLDRTLEYIRNRNKLSDETMKAALGVNQ